MVNNILTKQIPLILPTFTKNKKEKRGIITTLVTSFIGLAYDDIPIYLNNISKKCYEKRVLL